MGSFPGGSRPSGEFSWWGVVLVRSFPDGESSLVGSFPGWELS